jgi:hypothetical protein
MIEEDLLGLMGQNYPQGSPGTMIQGGIFS